MNLSLRLNDTATKLAIWTSKNPLASRLLMVALPVTLAAFTAVVMRHPIIAPPCGTGTGGTGGSC